jgi:hypothetical protein
VLTTYDHEHMVTYMRVFDAHAEGADWKEVARVVLDIDPGREPARAWNAFESHLARAKWPCNPAQLGGREGLGERRPMMRQWHGEAFVPQASYPAGLCRS